MDRDAVLNEVKDNLYPRTSKQNIALAILAFTVIIPSLILWGEEKFLFIFELLGLPPLPTLVFVCAVGGSVSLSLYYPKPGYFKLGIIPGLIFGIGVLIATNLYLFYRHSVFIAELAIPALIGCSPGWFLYQHLIRKKAFKDMEQSQGNSA